jgi:hypothetical protein
MSRKAHNPFDAVGVRLGELRFKNLFLLAALLLVADLLIPDLVPLIDEILLGLLTMLFWSWRRPRDRTSVVSAGKSETP